MKSPVISQAKNFNKMVSRSKGNDRRASLIKQTELKSDGSINWKKVQEFRKQSMYSK